MATEGTKTTETAGTTEAERDSTTEPEQSQDTTLRKNTDDDRAADTGTSGSGSKEQDDIDIADEEYEDSPGAPVGTASAGGFAAGAAAVVSAGLGLCSLVGTPLSDMLRARKELMGQIEASAGGGGGADQIQAFYNTPWHTAALVNGFFAVVAVVIGGALLALFAGRVGTAGVGLPTWTKAVALGGVVLGALGLIVAGGMYFDLFASTPELPKAPPAPAPQ